MFNRVIQSIRYSRFRTRRPMYEYRLAFIRCCWAIRNSLEFEPIAPFVNIRTFFRRVRATDLRFTRVIGELNNTSSNFS